jgi:hypothetical protein
MPDFGFTRSGIVHMVTAGAKPSNVLLKSVPISPSALTLALPLSLALLLAGATGLLITPCHHIHDVRTRAASERGVRLAQKMQVGPCISVGMQLEKAEVGPTSGPTWRLSHLKTSLQAQKLFKSRCHPLELGPSRGCQSHSDHLMPPCIFCTENHEWATQGGVRMTLTSRATRTKGVVSATGGSGHEQPAVALHDAPHVTPAGSVRLPAKFL